MQAPLGMAAAPARVALERLLLAGLLCCTLRYAHCMAVPNLVNASDPVQLAAYMAFANEPLNSTVERLLGCKCLPHWEAQLQPSGKL